MSLLMLACIGSDESQRRDAILTRDIRSRHQIRPDEYHPVAALGAHQHLTLTIENFVPVFNVCNVICLSNPAQPGL